MSDDDFETDDEDMDEDADDGVRLNKKRKA
jgi:hypothetical protein